VQTNLQYGEIVDLSFKVKDTVSGNFVFPSSETSTVYLTLSHVDKNGKPFTSNRNPAKLIQDVNGKPQSFDIEWFVNPNAIKGKGFLGLVAQLSEDKDIPIHDEKSTKVWKADVEIGGEIEHEPKIFSNDMDRYDTVFFIQFSLSCNKQLLQGANLISTINFKDQSTGENTLLFSVPVAHGSQPGNYQVSWKLENTKVQSGTYVVNFYREVDINRIKGDEKSVPFFSIDLVHEKKESEGGVFPSEFFVLVLFFGGYGYMMWTKMDLEGTRKKQK